jgi:predicted RNA binding protein YcfA (HicA-like mRNA interferase family)
LPKISPISPNKLIKVLEKEGFKVARQKGSHVIMINDEKNRIVIPMHPGKDIKPVDYPELYSRKLE